MGQKQFTLKEYDLLLNSIINHCVLCYVSFQFKALLNINFVQQLILNDRKSTQFPMLKIYLSLIYTYIIRVYLQY